MTCGEHNRLKKDSQEKERESRRMYESGCGTRERLRPIGQGRVLTHDEIVDLYIHEHRVDARKEMQGFESERSPSEAIRRAALCLTEDNKRHSHQRRIPRALLEQVEERLQEVKRYLAKATDFDALHKLVDKEIRQIKGIGPLTVYDITHRIGAYYRKAPEYVYLHAGTRIGAAIFGIKGESFDPKIPKKLPKEYSCLSPAEIEDCLCIYKDKLKREPY
jgi:hypothetical protein